MIADIITERLRLVAITDEMLASEAGGGVPDLPGVTTEGWPPEHWEPHVFDYIQKQYADHPQTRGWHRYVVLRAAGAPPAEARLIGTLGASPKPDGDVEFGYSLLPEVHRRGYGTEAAKAFAAWLAHQPGVRSLSAQTYPSLTASIRVMEACGLTPAGDGDDEGTVRYRKILAG